MINLFGYKLTKISIILAVILLVGLFLRLHNIENWNLSCDEAFSERLAGLGFVDIVKESIRDVHPPFYFFTLHMWVDVFGNSEYALRGFSVLFGVASIWLTYVLSSSIFNKRVGSTSAFLMSISSYNIQYSQDARMYTLLLFLSLLSVYLFLKILDKFEDIKNEKYLFGLVLVNTLLLYTHLYGSLLVLFEILWLVFRYYKLKNLHDNQNLAVSRVFYSIIASLILFLPWVPVVIRQIIERPNSWLTIPSPLEILKLFSGNYVLLFLFFPLAVAPIFWKKIRNEKTIFLSLAFVFIIAIPLLISIIIFPSIRPRYIIFASAIFYILIAYSIDLIKSKTLKINLALWVIVLSCLAINDFYKSPDNADWRNTAKLIDQQANPNDLVIFNAGFALGNGFNYYSDRTDLMKVPFPKVSEEINEDVDENNIEELDEFLPKNYTNVWVVYHSWRDPDDLIAKKIGSYGYVFADEQEFPGVFVDKFVK